MIGSGLKKLATSNQMRIDRGVAYGNFRGYATTFSEGAGYKLIQITTTFSDEAKLAQLNDILNSRDLYKEFRVQEIVFSQTCIGIVFYDNPGTMKKLTAFIDWFFPLLGMYGAAGANICTECGCEITAGQWHLIDGAAYYLHDNCVHNVQGAIAMDAQIRRQEDPGSYASGLIGAFLGAALGAIVWAIVLNVGYVAAIVGFLIGWLAEKGYELLNGKRGKGKVVILIFAVIFGVLLGTAIGEIAAIALMIVSGELYDMTMGDLPLLLGYLLTDSEYMLSVLADIGLGIVFAALGVISLLIRAGREVSDVKTKKLR